MAAPPRRRKGSLPGPGLRFGPSSRASLWRRLLLPGIALIFVVGWFVVPQVKFAILKRRYDSTEGEGRRAALEEILKLRNRRAIPILLDEFVRSGARDDYLDPFLDLVDEGDLDLLIDRLGSEERDERMTAAFAIASLIDRPWVHESREVLDSLPEIYGALIDGLSGGAVAQDYVHGIDRLLDRVPDSSLLDPLIERLRSADGGDRTNAIRAVYYLRESPAISKAPRVLELIREALGADEMKVRLAAALVLEDQAGPEDREPLLRLLDDPQPLIREAACRGLGGVGGEGVADALLLRLADADAGVRDAAVISLGHLRVERIIPHLLRMLRETPTMEVRRAGAVVTVPNPYPSEAAAGALASFPTDEVLNALGAAAADADVHERIRLQAIRSLAAMAPARALSFIEPVLDDPGWSVRLEAITAVQAIGGRAAVLPLLGRLRKVVRSDDPPPGEIQALGDALRQITGKDHGPYPGDTRYDSEAAIRQWEAWLREEPKGR